MPETETPFRGDRKRESEWQRQRGGQHFKKSSVTVFMGLQKASAIKKIRAVSSMMQEKDINRGSLVRGVCPMQEDRGNTSVACSQFNLCT